ncbi:glycosyltransferase family 2 protein [Zhongshania marina]|nr:glycosyltransferase family A protein [Marortus luteolus]
MSNKSFQISVVIPTYNRQELLFRAIDSVLCQSYAAIEVIVVDDGSSDSTVVDFENSNYPENVRLISTGGRKGACYARNLGVQNATGDFVAFQDSDDIWFPNKLRRQVEALCAKSAEFCFSSFIRLQAGHPPIIYPNNVYKAGDNIVLVGGDSSLIDFGQLYKNKVSTQTLLVDRDAFLSIGGFDENLPRFQDWDIAIRLFQKYDGLFLEEPLAVAYVQSDSITKNYHSGVLARKAILRKYISIYKKNPFTYLRFLLSYYIRVIVGLIK